MSIQPVFSIARKIILQKSVQLIPSNDNKLNRTSILCGSVFEHIHMHTDIHAFEQILWTLSPQQLLTLSLATSVMLLFQKREAQFQTDIQTCFSKVFNSHSLKPLATVFHKIISNLSDAFPCPRLPSRTEGEITLSPHGNIR